MRSPAWSTQCYSVFGIHSTMGLILTVFSLLFVEVWCLLSFLCRGESKTGKQCANCKITPMSESLSNTSLVCYCKCWSTVTIWCLLSRWEGTLPSCFALQLVRKGISGMVDLSQCQTYWCTATAACSNKTEEDVLGVSSCNAAIRIFRNNLGSDRFSILETPCMHFFLFVTDLIFTLPKLYLSWTEVLCSIADDAKLCGGVEIPKG